MFVVICKHDGWHSRLGGVGGTVSRRLLATSRARWAGCARRQQAVLGRGWWDAEALRDIARGYALETLADEAAVLVMSCKRTSLSAVLGTVQTGWILLPLARWSRLVTDDRS